MNSYVNCEQKTSIKDFPIRENMHILNIVDIAILIVAITRLIVSFISSYDINLTKMVVLVLVKTLCFLLLNIVKLGLITTVIYINRFTKKDISFLKDLNENIKVLFFTLSHISSCVIFLVVI